jgi:hypothetical protein
MGRLAWISRSRAKKTGVPVVFGVSVPVRLLRRWVDRFPVPERFTPHGLPVDQGGGSGGRPGGGYDHAAANTGTAPGTDANHLTYLRRAQATGEAIGGILGWSRGKEHARSVGPGVLTLAEMVRVEYPGLGLSHLPAPVAPAYTGGLIATLLLCLATVGDRAGPVLAKHRQKYGSLQLGL